MALSPDVTVEVAFTSGYTTAAASRTWTDDSAYVESDRSISITRGRPDQFSAPQPSRLTLTLDNRDGRFTPENASGAYYPNVKKGRPIRVRARRQGGAGYVDRFVGYIDEWPVEWPDGSTGWSTVTISASSRQARLGRSAPFKSIVEEEYLYDGPVLYFPLGEPQGSTTAGNIAPGRTEVLTATQVGTGGTLTFGQGTGPGTDDLTAPVFTPVDTSNGLVLRALAVTPITLANAQTLDFELFLNTTTVSQSICTLSGDPLLLGSTRSFFTASIDGTGHVALQVRTNGVTNTTVTSTAVVTDGATHHISLRLAISGSNMTPSLMIDGAARVTGSTVAGAPVDWYLVDVGGSSPFAGTLAHAAIFVSAAGLTDARVTVHSDAGLTGFAGEASGARIQRLARLAGIPTAEIVAETGLTGSMAHRDTTGEQPSTLMQDVADTEDGVVFDGPSGTLTFHARSHRYSATSAFTLSATAGDVEANFTPRLDDQHLINDMTASRPSGVTIRSTNPDSITEYGYYRESLEVLTTSDNEVQSRADWEVNRFGTPRVTIPNVRVNLLGCTASQQDALLAADIGTKFTVSGLPSQAPASTMDFFVEGVSEDIGPESYFIEFNVSAAAYANVWTLDSATLSQLDSTTVLAY